MAYSDFKNNSQTTNLLIRNVEKFSNLQFDDSTGKEDKFKIEIYS